MKEQSKGLVNKLHLIYIIICMSVVILAILTITIWHKEDASTGLNNAATASSIVLAVVAIVMTIVDVAGQRKTVSELKETAETLGENLLRTNEGLSQIEVIHDRLIASMDVLQKSHDDLRNGINELQKKYDGSDPEKESDILKELKKLKENIERNSEKIQLSPLDLRKIAYNAEPIPDLKLVHDYIFNVLMNNNERHSVTSLIKLLHSDNIYTTAATVRTVLNMMEILGLVVNEEGKFFMKK